MTSDDFILDEDDYTVIPIDWPAEEYYNFTFEGWKTITFSVDDDSLRNAFELSKCVLKNFIEIYKSTHVFTQPVFCMTSEPIVFKLKIGIMRIEEYENRMKNYHYD